MLSPVFEKKKNNKNKRQPASPYHIMAGISSCSAEVPTYPRTLEGGRESIGNGGRATLRGGRPKYPLTSGAPSRFRPSRSRLCMSFLHSDPRHTVRWHSCQMYSTTAAARRSCSPPKKTRSEEKKRNNQEWKGGTARHGTYFRGRIAKEFKGRNGPPSQTPDGPRFQPGGLWGPFHF